MKEQATIFFRNPEKTEDVFTLPKENTEIRTFMVTVDEVKQDNDFTPEQLRYFHEVEIFRAANFLVLDNPDLKEKLDLGDYLHIDGCWFVWDSGWVKLASEIAPTRFEDTLPNVLSEEEETVEEKKRDECCIEIVRASSPTRTRIIMHEGDYLCFDNRCFCFDGLEWTETTGQEISNVLSEKENVMKEQATIFFHIPVGEQNILTIPKNKIEVKTYDVELEEVIDSEPRNSETAEEKWDRLREIVIRNAAKRLITDYPELRKKLNAGDLLHISGYWFGWNSRWYDGKWNDEWVLLSNGFVGESYQQAVQKETREKNEMKVGRPDVAAELTTLISCYIKALIREKYNGVESTKESDVLRYYLGATLLGKCGEMTVKELRILTYLVAQEVAIEMGTMFGNVLDILKENGIDLWKIANEEKEKK